MAAGSAHSLVLLQGGQVLSFGCGVENQLGHGDWENETTPKAIVALAGKKVVQVAAGAAHSLVLLEGGQVLSWGSAEHGQLGHGDTPRDQGPPKTIAALGHAKAVQISGGHQHSAVLLEGGQVLTFGSGLAGQHGHGDGEDQLVPREVAGFGGASVVEVAAGCYHTAMRLGAPTENAVRVLGWHL